MLTGSLWASGGEVESTSQYTLQDFIGQLQDARSDRHRGGPGMAGKGLNWA